MAILSYLLFTVDNSCNSYAATLSPTFLALIPEINSTTQISSSFFCNLRPYLQSFFTVVDPWLNLVGLLQHSVRCDSSTGIFLSCVSRYTFLLLAQTSSFSFSPRYSSPFSLSYCLRRSLRWFMPVSLLLTFIIGSFLGWIVILITKPPPHLRGLIVGCCAAGNLGNMPLIIIPAVCKDIEGPFGDPENCHKYGMGYVAFSMAIGSVYIWTYVYNLMRVLSNSPTEAQPSIESSYKVPLISSKEEEEEDNHKVGRWDRFKRRMVSLSEKVNLSTIFAPTTIAAIIALVIGLIDPLRELIIGSVAPLGVLQDSVTLVGDGAIPATTLIIGGNLLKGMRSSGMKKSSIAGVLVARYILLPISGVLIVRGAYKLDLITSEPLYQFVLLIQYAVPPAMSLGTITQLFGTGESECSVIMLWAYGFASVSLTAWPTFFMWLVA